MALVSFNNIRKEYHGRDVLDNISFEINGGQKVGLIGPNGSGKTTILKILCDLEKPNTGTVDIAPSTRIGYVPQHVQFDSDQVVMDYLLQEHRELKIHLRDMEQVAAHAGEAEIEQALSAYQKARDHYDHHGGDHFESRARAMVEALGLNQHLERKISQLSGGEKNVLGMTKALLDEPNLLILDEPGNHLDYLGLAWLEDFLIRFRGAVLVVSHNRYLLDKVTSVTLELERGKIESYPGNYSAYREIKQERIRAQQLQYQSDQKRIAHLENLVQKFADIAQGHASDNTWGKRLRARRSQLEREKANATDKPPADMQQITPDFQAEATRADIALQVNHYSKSYGDLALFENATLSVNGGQRWALVGTNGCGKTTLLRDIVKEGKWANQVLRIGPSLTVGYCAQEQEVLDGENTVYEELFAIPNTTHEMVLGILARFLFTDEEVNKKIRHLSGGERNRLQLARLMLLKPNFLILDEPTNHLDIPTREAVENALSQFQGTLLVVSHDRYFLDKVVDHVAQVQERKILSYDGNFTNFWQKLQEQTQKVTGHIAARGKVRKEQNGEKSKAGGLAWKERKAQQAIERKRKKEIEQLETNIADREAQQQQLEAEIAQAFTDGDHEKGNRLSVDLERIQSELQHLYDNWMEVES